jgi:hypothetical protein
MYDNVAKVLIRYGSDRLDLDAALESQRCVLAQRERTDIGGRVSSEIRHVIARLEREKARREITGPRPADTVGGESDDTASIQEQEMHVYGRRFRTSKKKVPLSSLDTFRAFFFFFGFFSPLLFLVLVRPEDDDERPS